MTGVLAFDPSISEMGYAHVFRDDVVKSTEKGTVERHGLITTKSSEPLDKRLNYLRAEIQGIIRTTWPQYILIENLNLQFEKKKIWRQLMLYAAAWGCLYGVCAQTIALHCPLTQIHIVPLPKPDSRMKAGMQKQLMILRAKQKYDIKTSEHEAYAIFWAMNWKKNHISWQPDMKQMRRRK